MGTLERFLSATLAITVLVIVLTRAREVNSLISTFAKSYGDFLTKLRGWYEELFLCNSFNFLIKCYIITG